MSRLLVASLGLALAVASASAQTLDPKLPRTPSGRPDFSGYWNSQGLTTTERGVPGPLVVDSKDADAVARRTYDFLRSPQRGAAQDPNAFVADVQHLANVGGEWRSSIITTPQDGKLPLTAEGRRRFEAAAAGIETTKALGPEQRDDFERCIAGTGRTPLSLVPANNFREIVQTRDHVVIYSDEGGDIRRIKLNGAPLPREVTSRYGDSIGRWEGDELVVTTNNLLPFASNFPWGSVVIGENSRVVERFRLIAPDELLYRYTVDDPTLYSQPWSAEFSMRRSANESYEFACHEANYSIVNILQAARIKDH